jgi:hypothetical protein
MMEFVLVALMMVSPGEYEFRTMASYDSMAECEKSRLRAVKNGTTRIVSLVCARKDSV